MEQDKTEEITRKNIEFYDNLYSDFNVDGIIRILDNLKEFMDVATTTHNSWVGLYYNNFQKELKGKRVLELGCGDCTNAAVMAGLGAEVYGNDIASVCGNIVNALNNKYTFEKPIQFIYGDFLKADFPDDFFDVIVGKAFVHHLTHEQEVEFAQKCARILKKNGIVRYCEPAVNNKFFDELRWMVPVKGRPSKLQKEKFEKWLKADPHPIRDNSSAHYKLIGKMFFRDIEIIPFGWIERFNRLLPRGNFNRKFSKMAFRLEKIMPHLLNHTFARSQVVTYRNPK
jgi:SAM-dependent methyltransferase